MAVKSGVKLSDGEQVIVELEAEMWPVTKNYFVNLGTQIIKFFAGICGTKYKGYVIVTNKRIIEISKSTFCFAFTTGSVVRSIMPHSILDVGYERVGIFLGCFCPAYFLFYHGHTRSRSVKLMGFNEEQAAKLASDVYNAIGK